MHVVGTAGHVDHGKSTLVQALTGIDPDRLKEEKAREMTIDLGFAWLELPGAPPVGIIDVPGHRDFIENMLAGVGGIDAALFVVAADEGPMPQTREHLAILDLLRIPTGLIALTKIDLAPDPAWRELVLLDLAELTAGTALEHALVVPVSARTGDGLDELRRAIAAMLQNAPPPLDSRQPRLWVDRVFSVSGFGTVVTGTLLGGALALGQDVEFQPGGLRGRVRGLQSHHRSLELASPGSRVAVNVAGVERSRVARGALLTLPGALTPTRLAAVHYRHLAGAARPLKHQAEVKVFAGSAESLARVRLLEGESIPPGGEGWLQLELRDPLPLSRGDRFILRLPSPGETIGGGDVIDPAPGRRWRKGSPEALARIEALAHGDAAQLVAQAADRPRRPDDIAAQTGLDADLVRNLLDAAQAEGGVVALGDGLWIAAAALDQFIERAVRRVEDFHRASPIRPGVRPEKLRGQLGLSAAEAEALVAQAEARGALARGAGGVIALPGHTVRWTRAQAAAVERLLAAFEAAPFTPPSVKEAAAIVGDEVLAALIEQGELRQASADVLFRPAVYAELAAETRRLLAETGRVSVKELRDRFHTSRKYALAFLEHLNGLGVTRRDGDDHVLASGDWGKVG
ncbi:MAG: selenocysteine-specific translation elongation factor [Anaerolineae bacterium]|nr:selenocysteine-specific translation elongation factor [Anaerolineae bacterium]